MKLKMKWFSPWKENTERKGETLQNLQKDEKGICIGGTNKELKFCSEQIHPHH